MISPDLHLSPLSEMSFSHPVPGGFARWMCDHGSHTKGGHIPAAAQSGCPKPPPKLCSHHCWKCSSHLEKALGSQLWPSCWPKGETSEDSPNLIPSISYEGDLENVRTPLSQGQEGRNTDLNLNLFELLQDQPEALIWFDFTSFISLYSLNLNWTKTRGTVNWKLSVNSSSVQKEFQLKAISSCYPK